MRQRYLIWFFLFLLSALPAAAQLDRLGVYPFENEIGARPLGMGGAFTALADDGNAILYNSGGLAWAKGISLTVREADNFTAVQAYPIGNGSSLGLAVINSQSSDIPAPIGLASSSSNLVYVGYGTKLFFLPDLYKEEAWQRVGLGFTLKGLMSQTLREPEVGRDRSGYGWDLDVGALWKGGEWWSLGITGRNIIPQGFLGGGQINWDVTGEERIPASLNLAFASRIIGDIYSPVYMEGREFLLAGELNLYEQHSPLLRLGGEWGLNKIWFLRAGLQQQWRPSEAVTNLNLGVGWRGEEWGLDLSSYREPLNGQGVFFLSLFYSPRDWVVIKKLDLARPGVILDEAIEQISLADNIETYEQNLEVTGRVKAGVEVFVNDLPAVVFDDQSFKVTVPLQTGKNLLVVEARFESEKKFWKYKVLRKAKIQVAEEKEALKEITQAVSAEAKEKLEKKVKEVRQVKRQVEELVTMGVIEVTPEAEFRLEASITRGELATWLAKATGLPLPVVDRDYFIDVPRNHPLARYIKAAVDWELLQPFADGSFRPDSPVSREEGEKLFQLLRVQK